MSKFDILGIGNAIVDILSFVGEDIIEKLPVNKGAMTLIDQETAQTIYNSLGEKVGISGGSAANTVAGVASLGGKSAFIGRVKNDNMGKVFYDDMDSIGVHFSSPYAIDGKDTACCLVMVTPNAERTMATYLGACTELDESFIDEALIKNSKITYIEGYLWDEPKAKSAIRKAIKIAKDSGSVVAFTLSDPFCVGRHRAEFLELLPQIDILFANQEEAKSLFECEIRPALGKFSNHVPIAVITRSEQGSNIVTKNEIINISPVPISKLVDTTGAGDMYAAGFLFGISQNLPLEKCGNLGSAAASSIIQQLGARPIKPLREFITA